MVSSLPSLPSVLGTDPSSCILDAFRIAIAKRVSDALPPLTLEQAYTGVDYGKKGVDFTVALPRFRLPGKPDELAKKVITDFQPDDFVSSITHDKQFLHFQLNTSSLISEVLNQIHTLTYDSPTRKPSYGTNTSGAGKKLVIEYSFPNIAKSFHVGHLRSTIIGAFLDNFYKACGWEVISFNYLGDWGIQFGMITTGFEKYGSQEELEKDAIKHLYDVYVKVSKDADSDPNVKIEAAKWFKRMEDGDETALVNWRVWREMSVKKYTEEYERLNVSFNVYTGESEVGKEWQDRALPAQQKNLNLNFGKHRRTIGIYLAGALFALANWTFLDAVILSAHANPPYDDPQIPPPVHVQFVDWVPGICSLLGMLIINLIDKDRIRGDDYGDSTAVWRARLFLFIGFAFMAGGLAGSVSLLVLKYVMMDYPEQYTYYGYANVSQNVALMLSAVVLWIAQSAQTEYDYSLTL